MRHDLSAVAVLTLLWRSMAAPYTACAGDRRVWRLWLAFSRTWGGDVSVRWRSRVFIDAVRGRRLRAARMVSAVVALSLAATLSDVVVLAERADAKPKPLAKPSCPDQRPDRVSALVTARLCKKKVEVGGLTSETTQVFAKPD